MPKVQAKRIFGGFCGRRGHRKTPCQRCKGCRTCCSCDRNVRITHKKRGSAGTTWCGVDYMMDRTVMASMTKGSPTCPRCLRAWSAYNATYRVQRSDAEVGVYQIDFVAKIPWHERVRDFFTVTGRTLG